MAEVKVFDIYPPDVERATTARCAAPLTVATREQREAWNKYYGHTPMRKKGTATCGQLARYMIEGKWFCRQHAALALLDRVAVRSPP